MVSMDQFNAIKERMYGMRRKLATWGLFVVAAYVAFYVVFGGNNGFMVYEKKKAEYRQITSEVERLKQENQLLAEHNKALQTDRSVIEKEAREQLKYARPGEVVYVLPAPPAQTEATATAQNGKTKK